MSTAPTTATEVHTDEIAALVSKLRETQHRLQELTGGVDAVLYPGGQSYLLQEAQERLSLSEAAQRNLAKTQTSILNALPAQIALVDPKGVIVSINDAWRELSQVGWLQVPNCVPGQNYLEICQRVEGTCAKNVLQAAAGIRSVLDGRVKDFEMEYPIQTPSHLYWFRLMVTPLLNADVTGAAIMHLDITEQKLIQDAVRESEERFRNMFNAAATGIAVSTPMGRYLQANAAYCHMLGYTLDELLERDFASVTYSEDLNLNLRMRDELLAGHRDSFVMEKRYVRKNGELVWTRHSVSAAHGVDGEISILVVVAEDINERKLAEIQLKWKTAFFDALVHSSLDGILVVNNEGHKILLNQRAVELWDIPANLADEVDHKNRLKWMATQTKDPRAFMEKVTFLYENVDAVSRDEINLTNGKWLDRYSAPVRGGDGKHYGRIWVYRDITDRKRTEARLHRMVDSEMQGVFFWNRRGEITQANDAFLNITGYSREDLQSGRINWAEMAPVELVENDRRALAEIDSRGVCTPYEKEYIRKDRGRVPILIGAAIFEDNKDEGISFILDLSERKRLEQQFLRMQRMESIGTLASGIAHDLNNVLAPIMMSVGILKMKLTDSSSQELLASLNSSVERGANMVRQVLSFARGVEDRKVDVQLKHIINEVKQVIQTTFPKNIQVKTLVTGDLRTILGDPTQLHQVLLNLCVNARDAMPEGGSITITAENVNLDEHYAALNPEARAGPYLCLQVEDNGTGMPPTVIEKIFDPFFTTKEIGKGTGLGLSTSLGIIKNHGGFIRVYSELGRGSVFKLYLPSKEKVAVETGKEGSPDLPRGKGELILVVDDEIVVRKVTQETLETYGYRVVLASDGAEAVAIFARRGEEIAAVLTDMMMPVMNGPALIEVLLKLKPSLPIIAASGLPAGRHFDGGQLNVKHFLNKPYTAQALLLVLQKVLSVSLCES